MSFLPSLEIYNDDVPRSAAMNMALDEVLWQTETTPQLRLYEWDHLALSFGYFGQYADVAQYEDDRELVRRCTGGGIVFHGNDLTYALIIPAGNRGYERSSMAIYAAVHEAVQIALHDGGIAATLVAEINCRRFAPWRAVAERRRPRNASPGSKQDAGHVAQRATATERATAQSLPNSCFANPVTSDVLVHGEKVAGAAQRRSRRGLLQQGSIQNIRLPDDFAERFSRALSAKVIAGHIDRDVLDEARRLAKAKYQSESWLKRR